MFLLAAAVALLGWALTCGAWQFSRVTSGITPPEPRQFGALTLVAVGTGNAYENPSRGGPCTAVGLGGHVLLIDVGRGVAEGLRAARIPARQPEAVLLTNLLPENTVGLDDLLAAASLDGRREPLRVLGPPGTRALVSGLVQAHAASLASEADALDLPPPSPPEALEVSGGDQSLFGELSVRAGELPGGPLPALAWRVEGGGRSALIAGTGWAPDALVELARGADLLLHEAGFSLTPEQAGKVELAPGLDAERLLREARLHTSVRDVGRLAQRAGVATLGLVRLRPPPVFRLQLRSLVAEDFSGSIWIPEDGDAREP